LHLFIIIISFTSECDVCLRGHT